MDKQFSKLPPDVSSALEQLTKVAVKHQLPIFCLMPIPQSPIYVRQYMESSKALTTCDKTFIEQMMLTQYASISELRFENEMVDSLKVMKEHDPYFEKNVKQVFSMEGYDDNSIYSLINKCKVKKVVDYSLIDRLAAKEYPEHSSDF